MKPFFAVCIAFAFLAAVVNAETDNDKWEKFKASLIRQNTKCIILSFYHVVILALDKVQPDLQPKRGSYAQSSIHEKPEGH